MSLENGKYPGNHQRQSGWQVEKYTGSLIIRVKQGLLEVP
jgi:hypothetical protein